MKLHRILIAALCTLACTAHAQTDRDRLLGAWHLVRIEPADPAAQPTGMLVYTADGHLSVQLMYPPAAAALSNEYVRNGYEASFGTYRVDEATHTLTHHIEGANTGSLLVGKDLPRAYRFTPDGHLVLRSTRPDEHWSVTWAHD